MKKRKSKKLRLHRETLRELDQSDYPKVVGGSGVSFSSCDSGGFFCCWMCDITKTDCGTC